VWRIELYSSWIRRKRIIGAGCNTCENFTIFELANIGVMSKQRNLNVIIIGERQNLKNRRTEILVTNYKNNPTLFD